MPCSSAGCSLHGVADQYAGDLARYEETGTLAEPPIDDELSIALADADARVLAMKRDALLPRPRPQLDPSDGASVSGDLDVWRRSAVAVAADGTLQRMREVTLARIQTLEAFLERFGTGDSDLEEAPIATLGEELGSRRTVLRRRQELEIEERKLAIIDEEISAR